MSISAFRRSTLYSCVAAAMLSGCGGSQPPLGSPGAMAPSTVVDSHTSPAKAPGPLNAMGHYVYMAGPGDYDGVVYAYAIRPTGALRRVKGSPFKGAGRAWPEGIAIDPTGKFAYVANGYSKNVSGYAIDASTGTLTPVKGSPFEAGAWPAGVAITPSSKFAYVTNYDYPPESSRTASRRRVVR